MNNKKTWSIVIDYALILLGNLIFAVSVVYFIKPHLIPMGGLSGIALVLNSQFGLPIGVMTMLMNIPIFIMGYRSMGHAFLLRTTFSVLVSSVAIDVLPSKPPFEVSDTLVAALYGGLLAGIGLGLVFSRGATGGGTDIISKLINKKASHLSVGRIGMIINFFIIIGSAAIFGNPEAVLYALVVQFVSGSTLDALLSGMDSATAAFIVTAVPDKMGAVLTTQVKRGATAVEATGAFSGTTKTILLCAVRRHEMTALKKAVMSTDPDAFIILANAHEVLGRGFKPFVVK